MLRVSVVILAFNRCAVTCLCLEALGMQDLGPEEYEVIVVDDASSVWLVAEGCRARRRGECGGWRWQ